MTLLQHLSHSARRAVRTRNRSPATWRRFRGKDTTTPTRSHADIKSLVASAKGMVVQQMIQEDSVNIIVGESGIGKSPLLMQLALCVSAGLPFVGLKTRQGPVLCVDYENSLMDLDQIIDNLILHLGLPAAPDNLRFLHYPESLTTVFSEVGKLKPILVIVDALRGLDPNMEKDNTAAASRLRELHKCAEAHHCAFLLLHHPRKVDLKEPPPRLSATANVMDWLQQASGARALVNQTDARFAIEQHEVGESSLLVRGHFKLRGEVGPWPLSRVLNEEGEPLGYSRVMGINLLSQIERDRFNKLPQTFAWKDAEGILFPGRKGGKALSQLIQRAVAAGLVHRAENGKTVTYSKTP